MSAITVNNLEKSHGSRVLFRDANIQAHPGQRYGIVGANGSGKSTLLRIISGEEEASGGEVIIPKRLRVGVLSQDHYQYDPHRIIDVVMMGIPELWEAMVKKQGILERAHEHFDADGYAAAEDVVLRYDGYTMEARAGEILEGLNIPTHTHEQPLSTLSGGFKLRVLLAQTLASQPDILLLDEPTNHLDIASIAWLESFLVGFAGCVMVVSHDRNFLDGICTHVVDVDYEMVTIYPGNYSKFEVLKQFDRDQKEAEIQRREKEIADHKVFIERFKAKATKARQANSRAKAMAKITIDELPQSSRRYPNFRVETARHSGKEVVRVEDISKSYGPKQVLKDVSLTVEREDKLAIIGPNGIGKSTLLKIMMEQLAPDVGKTEWGYETHVGYFSQDHSELEEYAAATLQEFIWTFVPNYSIGAVRHALAQVLFTQDDADKLVRNLSGGEAARLLFCKITVTNPNVLVLDEPTNHLDLEGIEALAKGLKAYDGTLVFVSHDRWFVGHIADRIVEITPEGMDDYKGSYKEFLEHTARDHLKR